MRTTRFALVGVGNIGQGFLQIIAEKREFLRQRLGLQLLPVAAVDSGGAALNDAGLDVDELLRLKQTRAGVAAYPRFGQPGLAPLDALQRAPANLRRRSARMCWSRPSSRACGVTYPMPLCRRAVRDDVLPDSDLLGQLTLPGSGFFGCSRPHHLAIHQLHPASWSEFEIAQLSHGGSLYHAGQANGKGHEGRVSN